MSEKISVRNRLHGFLLAAGAGALITAACLAAMAELMASRGYSGTAADPLAVVAVAVGSLCSGWVAAFWQKTRGLLCGLLQGLFFAALLAGLSAHSGTLTENATLVRVLAAVLCGSIGGLLGRTSSEKRKRH